MFSKRKKAGPIKVPSLQVLVIWARKADAYTGLYGEFRPFFDRAMGNRESPESEWLRLAVIKARINDRS